MPDAGGELHFAEGLRGMEGLVLCAHGLYFVAVVAHGTAPRNGPNRC
jgi:hypothetical protein